MMDLLQSAAKEYPDVHWLGFVAIWTVGLLPFAWSRAGRLPLWRQQIANAALHHGVCWFLALVARCTTGDGIFACIAFIGFGVGYSVLAIRRNNNRRGGILGLVFFLAITPVLLLPYTVRTR